ncbi:MAG: hypothetical protein RIM33_01740 [Alphaproteobacteria bacterium]
MGAFDKVTGRKFTDLDPDWLRARVDQADQIMVDLGTGQGKFVVDAARENPDSLIIGIDAAADNMADASRKSASSPKKGGLPNALFVRGAAERLPGPFAGMANTVYVQYPWGSLMRIVSAPDVSALHGIRTICRDRARLIVLLNYSVFEDRDYLDRLGMGDITDPAESDTLPDHYQDAGFQVETRELFHGDPPTRSAWGRHLVRGSARATLMIEATAIDLNGDATNPDVS